MASQMVSRRRISAPISTLISAAIQDTGSAVEDFGEGSGGQLDAVRS